MRHAFNLSLRILAIPAFICLTVSGCGEPAQDDTSVARPKQEVSAIRKLAGRWQSPVGPLPGMDERWFVLDIANDKQASLEIRGAGDKMDIVFITETGKVELMPNGDARISLDGAGPSLADFLVFTVRDVKGGHATLVSPKGNIPLNYKGL